MRCDALNKMLFMDCYGIALLNKHVYVAIYQCLSTPSQCGPGSLKSYAKLTGNTGKR